MKYQIEITRLDENPNFKIELEDYNSKLRIGYSGTATEYPRKEVESRVLFCELTEDEYQAAKKSILETFK